MEQNEKDLTAPMTLTIEIEPSMIENVRYALGRVSGVIRIVE